jgi:hypothetical protein
MKIPARADAKAMAFITVKSNHWLRMNGLVEHTFGHMAIQSRVIRAKQADLVGHGLTGG